MRLTVWLNEDNKRLKHQQDDQAGGKHVEATSLLPRSKYNRSQYGYRLTHMRYSVVWSLLDSIVLVVCRLITHQAKPSLLSMWQETMNEIQRRKASGVCALYVNLAVVEFPRHDLKGSWPPSTSLAMHRDPENSFDLTWF